MAKLLQLGRRSLLGALLWLVAIHAVAEVATIHLQDGSKLRGEVLSLKGGAYTVETVSTGTLRIPQDQVKLVEYGAASAPQASGSAMGAATNALDPGLLQSMQARMLQDPNIMALIESLKDDASVQAIVNDPEIQAAIASGDILSLLNNPRFKALMENPRIRSITEAAQGSR